MFTIQLHNLRFFSFHGVFEEERILGNEYEVNASVTFNENETVTELHQTIDYVKIYTIIKDRMNIPIPLLETMAQDLAQQVYDADNRITSIDIHVKKVYPPIPGIQGSVGVSYKKDF